MNPSDETLATGASVVFEDSTGKRHRYMPESIHESVVDAFDSKLLKHAEALYDIHDLGLEDERVEHILASVAEFRVGSATRDEDEARRARNHERATAYGGTRP